MIVLPRRQIGLHKKRINALPLKISCPGHMTCLLVEQAKVSLVLEHSHSNAIWNCNVFLERQKNQNARKCLRNGSMPPKFQSGQKPVEESVAKTLAKQASPPDSSCSNLLEVFAKFEPHFFRVKVELEGFVTPLALFEHTPR